jgi:phosphatidylglycerol---prolipoprotein diacylglyceryl transferase
MLVFDAVNHVSAEMGSWLTIQANQQPGITLPFGLKIRFYALAYLSGIIMAWWYVKRMLRAPYAPMSELHADDFIMWATLGVVLGGRLGHILFYDPEGLYLKDPLTMLMLWKGGMSFHGGVMGVTLAIILFSRVHKLNWLRMHDYIACGVPFGMFFGRLANFANGELWGAPTSLPWAVIFHGADAIDTPRHPSQLYQAGLEGLVLFAILWFLFWKTDARQKPGMLVGNFILWMGVFRFLVEFVRVADDQMVGKTGALHMGQWLCVPMILGGLFLIARAQMTKSGNVVKS